MNKAKSKVSVFATLIFSVPVISHATALTSCGPNICYQYDDAQAAVSLYGSPTLIGDSMRFLPSVFRVESSNTTGLAFTATGNANFIFDQVWAITPGFEIGSVQVTEAGDYSISGDSAGNPDAVNASLTTKVTDNASSESVSDTVNFSASGNTSGATLWSLQGNALNPADVFSASAQNIGISIQNVLNATTDEFGGLAWIQKKFVVTVGTVVAPTPVPEPAGLALMMLGIGMAGGAAVRRRMLKK